MTVHKIAIVGVLFAATFSFADDVHPPAPPAPPAAPARPAPPVAPRHPGINISVHDGQVDIDGLGDYIDEQIDHAMDQVDDANVPPAIRAKLKAKIGAMRAKLKGLKHLDAKDLDQLGKEIGKMGEEIGKEVEKEVEHGIAQHHITVSTDDDDDDSMADMDDDMDMDDDAVRDLGDVSLSTAQRDQLKKLRADSDKQVATAKAALAQASKVLRDQLDNPAASDADITKAIDAVSQQEAAIRKARILAWHGARRLLDDAQRKKVEGAAKGKTR
jgi:hypothetical protein